MEEVRHLDVHDPVVYEHLAGLVERGAGRRHVLEHEGEDDHVEFLARAGELRGACPHARRARGATLPQAP